MEEIKPCPFCKSTNIGFHVTKNYVTVNCLECTCKGPGREMFFDRIMSLDTMNEVIALWNNRDTPYDD